VDPVVELVGLDPARGLWGLRVTKAGSRIVMKIHDNGTLPEFEILQNDFAY
jgi:hypothetical protein